MMDICMYEYVINISRFSGVEGTHHSVTVYVGWGNGWTLAVMYSMGR